MRDPVAGKLEIIRIVEQSGVSEIPYMAGRLNDTVLPWPGLSARRTGRRTGPWPWATHARVALPELSDSAFVTFPRQDGTDFHRQLMELCDTAGFMPDIAQEVSPMHALIGLVGAGVGVAIVPDSVRKLRFAGVVYRQLTDTAERSRVYAIWHPDRLPAPARAFAEHLGIRVVPQVRPTDLLTR